MTKAPQKLLYASESQSAPEITEQHETKAEARSDTTVAQEDIDKLYADYEEKEQQEKVMENEQKDDAPTDRQMNM